METFDTQVEAFSSSMYVKIPNDLTKAMGLKADTKLKWVLVDGIPQLLPEGYVMGIPFMTAPQARFVGQRETLVVQRTNQ